MVVVVVVKWERKGRGKKWAVFGEGVEGVSSECFPPRPLSSGEVEIKVPDCICGELAPLAVTPAGADVELRGIP